MRPKRVAEKLFQGNREEHEYSLSLGRHFAGDRFQVQTAGIEAHGKNPRAITVMPAVDINVSAQQSKRVTEAVIAAANLVVTVCGDAGERCPGLPGDTQKEHWPLVDPAVAVGDEEAVMAVFRARLVEFVRV